MSGHCTLGIVGAGWRADFFRRLAVLLPERFTLVGAAVRRPEAVADVSAAWGVPVYDTPAELVHAQRPDLVIASVPPAANPGVVTALVEAGARVLCETPPAEDLTSLRRLWDAVGASGRVQVAEQYLLMPGHAARRELVSAGVIGQISSVQVSSTHGYHAVSIMRGLLDAGFGPATVTAVASTGVLVDPLSRAGWTDDDTAHPAQNIIATIDFGDQHAGVYDFTDNQWHNQLRHRRIVVRGSLGEISDDAVVRLAGPRTIVRSALVRSQLGHDLNLDGYDTEHLTFDGRAVYRNPFLGLRLMDEEIAIASLMVGAADWVHDDGPDPYPLRQACQDQLVSLAIEESLRVGAPVTTAVESWA